MKKFFGSLSFDDKNDRHLRKYVWAKHSSFSFFFSWVHTDIFLRELGGQSLCDCAAKHFHCMNTYAGQEQIISQLSESSILAISNISLATARICYLYWDQSI